MLSTWSTALCFLLILILDSSYFCLACAPSQPQVYVVALRAYNSLSAQEKLVEQALSLYPKSAWRFVARDNIAALRFPTDFVLVEAVCVEVADSLRSASIVKSISIQAEHGRALRTLLRQQKSDFEDGSEDFSIRHTNSNVSGQSILDKAGTETRARSIPGMYAFDSGHMWKKGFLGQGVKVAVFDTGLMENEAHFPNLMEKTDWTGENTTVDKIGHGTFVAGLIGGSHPDCPGIAPHADLYIFRVFTGAQISYTSWFLDAFNYALHIGIDVLNLSIGGPDFADNPFTEKVNELTASGVIVISAIGNDGPLWGSLNNPGDMMEVIGVGAVEPDASISSFSSRGMTTHELDGPQLRYGRVKPDLVTYGRSVIGPNHKSLSSCRRLSGTSVASPVVAGGVILLASAIPEEYRKRIVNPAGIKRALLESATSIPSASIYEQGAGLLDLNEAFEVLKKVELEFLISSENRVQHASKGVRQDSGKHGSKRALEIGQSYYSTLGSLNDHDVLPKVVSKATPGLRAFSFPSSYDLTVEGCSYMWPHCAQPLFKGAMTLNLNVTILNPAGVQGVVEELEWLPGRFGHFLEVNVTNPKRFWPWAAGMGVHITVIEEARSAIVSDGVLRFRVMSIHENTYSSVEVPIRVSVIPAPPREKRLLWDVYHSIRYPPGYVPRDNLAENKDMLDWLGDHPHTNYHALFRKFIAEGFFIDILDTSIICLDPQVSAMYGGLIILDSEDFFTFEERDEVERLVKMWGMTLIVAAEWYNEDIMNEIRFEDDSTRSWWSPIIAGGNVPALNNLLRPYDVAFGDFVISGDIHVDRRVFQFESGVPIVKFPRGSEVLFAQGLKGFKSKSHPFYPSDGREAIPIFGIAKAGNGVVLAYGDTNCIDTAYSGERCFEFFVEAVRHCINKCAGNGGCEKFLRSSHIVESGLIPSSNRRERAIYKVPSNVIKLLKPHSKVLENSNGSLTNSTYVFKKSESMCAFHLTNERSLAKSRADTKRIEVSFPSRKSAIAVGSVGRYYEKMDLSWYLTQSGEHSGKSASGPYELLGHAVHRRFGVPQWLVSLTSGIILIIISVLIRRSHNTVVKKRWKRVRTSKQFGSSKASSKGAFYSVSSCLLNFGRLGGSSSSRD